MEWMIMPPHFFDWAYDLWFWVTIFVPIVLPSAAAACLKLVPSSTVDVMSTVRDGQLGWIVVALGASGVYEAIDTMSRVPGFEGAGFFVFGALGLMFVGTVTAVGGAITPTQALGNTLNIGIRQWVAHYRLFSGSVVLTFIAAVLFTVMHYKAQQLHEATLHKKCSAVPDTVRQCQSPAPPLPVFMQPSTIGSVRVLWFLRK